MKVPRLRWTSDDQPPQAATWESLNTGRLLTILNIVDFRPWQIGTNFSGRTPNDHGIYLLIYFLGGRGVDNLTRAPIKPNLVFLGRKSTASFYKVASLLNYWDIDKAYYFNNE